jgi:phosphate transport system ATP-binding protein
MKLPDTAPMPHAALAQPEESSTMIAVENLDFYYGQARALHDISITIPANKVTAFIGPSTVRGSAKGGFGSTGSISTIPMWM